MRFHWDIKTCNYAFCMTQINFPQYSGSDHTVHYLLHKDFINYNICTVNVNSSMKTVLQLCHNYYKAHSAKILF